MKITEVETIYLRLSELDASRCDGTQDTLLIRIHTDEGFIGVGEVDSVPQVAKAIVEAPPSHSIAAGLKHLLIGENPFEIERLWDKMYRGTLYFGRTGPALHAISGVDIALWDIAGQVCGRPVSEMLGGTFRRKIKAYASALMPETPLEAGRLAEQFAKQGYLAAKFGWGPIGRDPKLDEELVRTIRSAIGDRMDIMIDAGLAWDLKGALRMAGVYEKYGVYWLEEPLHSNDIAGYRELASRTNLFIAGGEQESGRLAFARLLDEGQLDIIQPDLARCGGLTEGKKIAYMAYDRHKKVVPHAFKTGVLLAASTHFTAAIPNGFLLEYTMSDSPLARDLTETPIEFKDGYVILPEDRPGLGVKLNQRIVEQYRVG
ncbi:mandelate racemase/muconate lactonizing enzyme family protein [Paenibacillus ginsengarvi]|uniref:Mandelate racemase/muconate lactonizing enzyme family protein n=1 Tax=Paenibacillus ginsengarvi TaxID=400777 RepID=A0A3B0CG72_9BACL|nr:mandelate racemase/muconate lactonizing enzyme family protein [Paenibacillus ginsengarvi]RKN83888.1 mandelate racemase/muconate lactonizing enzyme family protein [Paenibacillus ginsengarvi]